MPAEPAHGKAFEQELVELCRQLSDARAKHFLLSTRNEELLSAKQTIQEDGDDILAYLKRVTNEHNDELLALQADADRISIARQAAKQSFEEAKNHRNNQHHIVDEQLLADKHLLLGKLHSLEETRIQRDALMQKYETMERAATEQIIRHKNEVYECERHFIIGKDKLQKEIDAKLNWLLEKFNSVMFMRIAGSSLRALHENIALNIKLNTMLSDLHQLFSTNESLHRSDVEMRNVALMRQEEGNEAAGIAHERIVELVRLVNEYFNVIRQNQAQKHVEVTLVEMEHLKKQQNLSINDCQQRKLVLEQKLHEERCLREDIAAEQHAADKHNAILVEILRKAKEMINECDNHAQLLCKLREFLHRAWLDNRVEGAAEQRVKRDDIYQRGKVGLVPRQVMLPSMISTFKQRGEQASSAEFESDSQEHCAEDEESTFFDFYSDVDVTPWSETGLQTDEDGFE